MHTLLFLGIASLSYTAAIFSSQQPSNTQMPKEAIGYRTYVDCSMVRPGQVRIANAGVVTKIEEALRNGYVVVQANKYSHIRFDKGASIIPASNALPVVLVLLDGKEQMILLDGHHDFLANQTAGGTTVPVEVKGDLRDLSSDSLWKTLKEKNCVYAKMLNGKEADQLPASFAELEDDPYRYFVKLAMWEAKNPETPFDESKPGTKGLAYPLAVKWKDKQFNPWSVSNSAFLNIQINKPFVEFAVADLLYKYGKEAGFSYTPGDEQDMKKFQDSVEKARAILLKHMGEDEIANSFNLIESSEQAERMLRLKNICEYSYPKYLAFLS